MDARPTHAVYEARRLRPKVQVPPKFPQRHPSLLGPCAPVANPHQPKTTGQTFEGGISAHPDAEAHGAYAFCALGCLAILDSPDRIIPR